MASGAELAVISEQGMEIKAEKKEKAELQKKVSAVPAVAELPLTAAAGYGLGFADGQLGTDDNKNPASIAVATLGAAVGIVAAIAGKPTVAAVSLTIANAPIAALAHQAGYKKGLEGKLKRQAAAAAAGAAADKK